MTDPKGKFLFEASWEVCNKIGGIYTVLSTKAKELSAAFDGRLAFIGPDVWTDESPSPYFEEDDTLLNRCTKLEYPYGITVRTGRWNVPGRPVAILVKFDGVYAELDSIFGRMWDAFGVDSLHAYGDYREGCAFGVAAALVIRRVAEHIGLKPCDVIAHFDEWTTAMGLLMTKLEMPQAATVFTTHATSIGRSICGNGKPLYDYFEGYNGDQMARELNMESKHSLEKAAAHQADCFTTVSDVTARECEQLLDIRPQVVTPNGFEPDFVPSPQRRASLRKKGRAQLLKIASEMTGRQFDDADTFIVATSGRNEYRNKGIDLYIDSLERLAALNPQRQVLAFVLVPAWAAEPDTRTPRFSTHRLHNEGDDAIWRRLQQSESGSGSKVTVIYVPCYLDGHDGVVDIAYYDLLPALDVTVFASYYEPWGYTPLESVAFGVPTVTTDKSGFGQWIISQLTNGFAHCGVVVLERTDSGYDHTASLLADTLLSIEQMDKKQYQTISRKAKSTADHAHWADFIQPYECAYAYALNKK